MERKRIAVAATLGLVMLASSHARAQVELLDTWNWVPTETGSQPWQDSDNWQEADFPDDPERDDTNAEDIANSTAANLSVPLTGDLTVDIQSPSATVAALRIGGTDGAVTTDVAGSGMLVFENYEQNAPDNDMDGQPDEFAFNRGNALIVSGGVPGATNVISAPVFINRENLEVGTDGTNASTNSLTISGNITIAGGPDSSSTTPTLTSFLPEGQQLEIAGTLTIPDNNMDIVTDFGLNSSGNPEQGAQGTILVSGNLTGDGDFTIGGGQGGGTTILQNANSGLTGRINLAPGNIVLGDDLSLGTAQVITANGTVHSTDDSRNIANTIGMSNHMSVAGEHSIEFSGELQMTNSRSWINQLPLGKELVLSGTQYIEDEELRDHHLLHEYAFDGSGTTVVTGIVANNPDNPDWRGAVEKRGSGALWMQGSQTETLDEEGMPTGAFNNVEYTGYTEISGGTLHLATIDDINTTSSGLLRSPVASRGGGIGLENGTLSGPDSAAFLSLFNNRSDAYTWEVFNFVNNSLVVIADDLQTFDAYDHGGLMLAENEYSMDVDFSSTELVNVRDMSLAARERGTTTQYTGTLTPYQNTYRLGGGGGTLELPNQNQLTDSGGTRNLVVQNGLDGPDEKGVGRVLLSSSNDYSGTTRVEGEPLADGYRGTTLAVTNLADGGQASSIGASSSDAGNLMLQGGTLQYVGSTNASTDRLFTLGTRGGGVDASGTGTVSFTNADAVAVDVAEPRTADAVGNGWSPVEGSFTENDWVIDINDTSDLVPGMSVSGQGIDDEEDGVEILSVASPTRIRLNDTYDDPNTNNDDVTLTFGTVDRDFTLSGTNTGDNTFAPLIADSSETGDINLIKEDPGKWVLTNMDNDWSGDTTIEDGTLSINNSYLDDDSDLFVTLTDSTGSIFDLDFAGTDVIDGLGYVDESGVPLTQPTGTYGSTGSGADHEVSWITGTGMLEVTGIVASGVDLAGDFNGDGLVNLADFTEWRDNLGSDDNLSGNGNEIGDSEDVVDMADYALWKENFGRTVRARQGAAALATGPAPLLNASAAVPEPGAAVLLLLGLAPLGRMIRKRA